MCPPPSRWLFARPKQRQCVDTGFKKPVSEVCKPVSTCAKRFLQTHYFVEHRCVRTSVCRVIYTRFQVRKNPYLKFGVYFSIDTLVHVDKSVLLYIHRSPLNRQRVQFNGRTSVFQTECLWIRIPQSAYLTHACLGICVYNNLYKQQKKIFFWSDNIASRASQSSCSVEQTLAKYHVDGVNDLNHIHCVFI